MHVATTAKHASRVPIQWYGLLCLIIHRNLMSDHHANYAMKYVDVFKCSCLHNKYICTGAECEVCHMFLF
jgi:hypothetical protein